MAAILTPPIEVKPAALSDNSAGLTSAGGVNVVGIIISPSVKYSSIFGFVHSHSLIQQ